MTKRFFLICTLISGLFFTSCKNAQRQDEHSGKASNHIAVEDSSTIKPTENTTAQIFAKPEVPILCYHRIEDGKKGDYTVSPETFSAHMKILSDSGFHSISPSQLYDYLVYNKPLPKKPVLITFDDSRTEHFYIAAPVMEKQGFKGAFFIMTITYNKKNYMTKDQISELAKKGHTVGLHTWDHSMVVKFKDTTDWQKQITDPKVKLEKITGRSVDYFAYPNGVYDHKGAVELTKHFKISFILTSRRDSVQPLQTVRRMIVPEWTAQGLLKSMRRTFNTN